MCIRDRCCCCSCCCCCHYQAAAAAAAGADADTTGGCIRRGQSGNSAQVGAWAWTVGQWRAGGDGVFF
eukprot:14157789-Alexandrium_andersonii.AAC.1